MKAPATLPPVAESKQGALSLEQARSRRARVRSAEQDHDDRALDAITERALQPLQAKAAIKTGFGDLIDAAQSPVPVQAKPEGTAGEIVAVTRKPGTGARAPAAAPPKPAAPAEPAKVKHVGLESFVVKYDKDPDAGPTKASFMIEFDARFMNDAEHSPEFAEFRQSAGHYYEIVAGPHVKRSKVPIRDDGYTRADDTRGHTNLDVDFHSNDYPGVYAGQPDGPQLSAEDDLRYSFTAEQTILDTSDGNKVIAKRGPHTVTITGKGDRKVEGIPRVFDK